MRPSTFSYSELGSYRLSSLSCRRAFSWLLQLTTHGCKDLPRQENTLSFRPSFASFALSCSEVCETYYDRFIGQRLCIDVHTYPPITVSYERAAFHFLNVSTVPIDSDVVVLLASGTPSLCLTHENPFCDLLTYFTN